MLRKYQRDLHGRIVNQENCNKFTDYTYKALLGLTGIYGVIDYENFDKIEFWEISGNYPEISLTVCHKDLTVKRTLDLRGNFIYNDLLVTEDHRNKGIAYSFLRSQVKRTIKAGLNRIECQPWGNYDIRDQFNGYITWGKLGYLMDADSQKIFDDLMDEYDRTEENIYDLLQTEGGLDFWSRNGNHWYGIFDLSPNSQSIQNFNDYAIKRNLKPL